MSEVGRGRKVTVVCGGVLLGVGGGILWKGKKSKGKSEGNVLVWEKGRRKAGEKREWKRRARWIDVSELETGGKGRKDSERGEKKTYDGFWGKKRDELPLSEMPRLLRSGREVQKKTGKRRT